MSGSAQHGSLLSTPLGAELLVSRLCRQLRSVTSVSPVILAPHDSDDAYRARITAASPHTSIAPTTDALAQALAYATFSDVLLFVDPRCLPVQDSALACVSSCFSARQVAHHLVAAEPSAGGAREHLNVDGNGHVRNVHRYYHPQNWPFIAGVAASVIPVSGNIIPLELMPRSLVALRQQLVSQGMNSRDILIEGGAFDLTTETGLLTAMERSVLEMTATSGQGRRSSTVFVAGGHSIDPDARLLGPIVVQQNVRIDARATIVGPVLIGEGAHVSSETVVAHALLGAHSHVPRGMVLRDHTWFTDTAPASEKDDTQTTYAQPVPSIAPSFGSSRPVLHAEPASDSRYLSVKRAFDVVIAAAALVVLAPLFAIVAALVWIESRGPILFGDEREGLHGRSFKCLKFRTMRNGTTILQHELKTQSHTDGPHFKLDADPRITTVGKFLRATNVDEIPQLINVLRGDMSLVGPRPSPFHENQICIPWRQARLSVRPGITGLWQMCRRDRAAGDFHQWIEYDLLYVQRMSAWLDVKVLLATLLTLGGKIEVPLDAMLRMMLGPAQKPSQPSFAVRRAAVLAHPEVPRAPRTLRRSLGHS